MAKGGKASGKSRDKNTSSNLVNVTASQQKSIDKILKTYTSGDTAPPMLGGGKIVERPSFVETENGNIQYTVKTQEYTGGFASHVIGVGDEPLKLRENIKEGIIFKDGKIRAYSGSSFKILKTFTKSEAKKMGKWRE